MGKVSGLYKENEVRAVKECALKAGLSGTGALDIRSLEYNEWIREICRNNDCHNYNTTWACPPAVGTLEECKRRCEQYRYMILFNKVYDLKGDYDMEKVLACMQDFKDVVDRFDSLVSCMLEKKLILSNEGCGRCRECTWPDELCRFPDKLHHSIEGYGLDIVKLSERAGLKFNNGPGTVTFFGALLYDKK